MNNQIYDNRELSWLKFNTRVLEEAEDCYVPLIESLCFVSIFSSNLDEFFMVRVGSLTDQLLFDPKATENKTKMTAKQQLDAIYKAVVPLISRKDAAYFDVLKRLKPYGIEHVSLDNLSKKDLAFFECYFDREILPLLSPQVIDKRHTFPFLNNKDIYIIANVETKSNSKLAIVKASGAFDRIIFLPDNKKKFLLVEELILHFVSKIFLNYKIKEKSVIRVTRNADIDINDGFTDYELDFRSVMTEMLKQRKKLSPVRLEVGKELSNSTIENLCSHLELTPKQVFVTKSPLDMSFGFQLKNKLPFDEQLFYKSVIPQNSTQLNVDESIIKQIIKKDILLSYPFENIKPFIQLLKEASYDPQVVSIKITLYRVATDSKIISALINAAENGKEVLVLVELRARFDEENNIGWSKQLEEAGCRVMYGPETMKVHSKLLLITRKNGNKVEYITQIGTGNYNEKTSTLYTDLSLITANKNIAIEASTVFNALSLGNLVEDSNHLLVAPYCLQSKVLEMLDVEINFAKSGEQAYFAAKLNSLSDKVIIDKLIEASQAGVKIDLIIRGICCLIGGVKGYTENITITSIVGRFLEHSRIYIFGVGERQRVYISSADFMTRNTVRRVEVAAPVYDVSIKKRLLDMFYMLKKDNVKTRIQQNDGTYIKSPISETALDSQMYFYKESYKNTNQVKLPKRKNSKFNFFKIFKK